VRVVRLVTVLLVLVLATGSTSTSLVLASTGPATGSYDSPVVPGNSSTS
jgi:hypothetical protein